MVQNTRWEKAFEVINRLKMQGLLNLHSLADISAENLQAFMKDLGFFRQKSQRIVVLCNNILSDFGDFENFCAKASREWLLSQKGIGNETCDSILC